jgi:uncharacterized protein involved in exopolysaccharide biosynthesis
VVQSTNQQVQSTSLWQLGLQYKWKMAAVFVAVVTATAVITAITPRQFASEAKIFIRLGRESVGLDPTVTTGQYVGVQETRTNEINSVVDLLNSRAIKEAVVDEMSPQAITGDSPGLLAKAGGFLNGVNLNPFRVYSERDEAIETLYKSLFVDSTRRSNIVTLSCQADSPELAREILQQVIKHATASHIRAHRTEGSCVFFEAQSSLQKESLQKAEQAMLEFKNEHRLADPTKQREIYLEQLGELQANLLQTRSELAAADVEVATMQASLRGISGEQLLETTSGMPLQAASEMRSDLYSLELKEKELASKYTDAHFLLQQIREQILQARRALTDESRNPQVIQNISESRGGVEQLMFERTALAAALDAKVKTLQEQLRDVKAEMDELNRNEVIYERLQRDVDLASANYRTYADKLEQSRIDEALRQDNISNINVFQEPTLSETPTSPRVKVNLAVGLFLAIVAAFAIPVSAGRTKPLRRMPPRRLQSSAAQETRQVAETPDNDVSLAEQDTATEYTATAPR